jgi:hypothetical protein
VCKTLIARLSAGGSLVSKRGTPRIQADVDCFGNVTNLSIDQIHARGRTSPDDATPVSISDHVGLMEGPTSEVLEETEQTDGWTRGQRAKKGEESDV